MHNGSGHKDAGLLIQRQDLVGPVPVADIVGFKIGGTRAALIYDVVVNATPLGMNEGDPLPMDMSQLDAGTFVGEVVMTPAVTPFPQAAQDRGCATRIRY